MHNRSPWSDGSTLVRHTNSHRVVYADLTFFTSNTSVSGGAEEIKRREEGERDEETRGVEIE